MSHSVCKITDEVKVPRSTATTPSLHVTVMYEQCDEQFQCVSQVSLESYKNSLEC